MGEKVKFSILLVKYKYFVGFQFEIEVHMHCIKKCSKILLQ